MSKPRQARKRPVIVEYVHWLGTEKSLSEVATLYECGPLSVRQGGAILIKTLEGIMTAWPGDYIVKGVEGEYYPVKESIFAKTYTPIARRRLRREKECQKKRE